MQCMSTLIILSNSILISHISALIPWLQLVFYNKFMVNVDDSGLKETISLWHNVSPIFSGSVAENVSALN